MAASNNNIPVSPVVFPVPVIECNINLTLTPQDNETYINYIEAKITECREIPFPTTADFWNCNLCGSDERYEQPFVSGDIIYMQVPITNNDYKVYKAYLFDSSGIIEDGSLLTQESVTDSNGNSYLNIQVATENLVQDCFYIRIFAFEDLFNETEITACIAEKVGLGLGAREADLLCRTEDQEEYGEFYSELYKRINENCEDTILIEGVYPKYDCKGNFYGAPATGTSVHKLLFRTYGTIEKTDFNFEETIVFNTKRSSKQTDTFLLRTRKMPPYVAEQVALSFNSSVLKIDGTAYKGALKFNKNFEEGRMWIVNTTLTKDCDEIDFLCQ